MADQVNCTAFANTTFGAIAPETASTTASLVIKTTLYCILLLFSTAGNILVIMTVYKDQSLRTTVDLLIVNMAVSDLLIPLFAIPKRIAELYMHGKWLIGGTFGSFLCKLLPFTENVSEIVSVLSLVIIAVERFYSVVFPIQKPLISKKIRPWLIGCSWFLAVAGFAYFFYVYRLRVSAANETSCEYTWHPVFEFGHAWMVEFYVFFSFVIALPMVLLIVLYSTIIVSLETRKRKLRMADEQLKRREKRNRRIVFLLVTVVVVFVLSWTPYSIFIFLHLFRPDFRTSAHNPNLRFTALFCSLSFTAVNPCLYYIFNKKYRRGFQNCLRHLQPLWDRCGASRGQVEVADREAAEIEMARNRASTIRFTDLEV